MREDLSVVGMSLVRSLRCLFSTGRVYESDINAIVYFFHSTMIQQTRAQLLSVKPSFLYHGMFPFYLSKAAQLPPITVSHRAGTKSLTL